MRRYACALSIFLASCAALDTHQAKLDQQQLRDVLMDYVDDQILDNLIRASKGMPIVHFDLTNITGSVTSKFTPTLGGSRTVTNVRTSTPTHSTATTTQTTTAAAGQTIANTVAKTASVVGGVVETVANPFNWGVSAERGNAIGIQADPLLDKPDVYAAYIKFLNTDVPVPKSPDLVNGATNVTQTTTTTTKTNATTVKTATAAPPARPPEASAPRTTETTESGTLSTAEEKTPKAKPPPQVDLVIRDFSAIKSLRKSSAPPSENVLIGPKRWKDGIYYWIPTSYRKEFFELCMATVVRPAAAGANGDQASQVVKKLDQSNAIERQRLLRSQ